MGMRKKIVFLFLIVFVFSNYAKQEESRSPGKPTPPVTLDICLKKPYFSSFFPADLQYVNDSHLYELIYNTLISATYSGRLGAELAECWNISADMKEYTFTLREKVKFHNGKLLTADDVIFTFKQLVKHAHTQYGEFSYIEGSDDFIAGKTEGISGLVKIDNLKFKIKLKQKFKYFLHFLTCKVASILPVDFGGLSKKEFEKRPIGTGPFKLQSRQAKTKTFKFIKNRDYFTPTGNVDQLNLFLPKKTVDIKDLLHFDLFVKDITPRQKNLLVDRKIINTSHDLETFIALNPKENKSVQDRRNRQLINYAINREQLVDFLSSGNCIPAHAIIPINLFGHNPYYRLPYLKIEKMERLLKENPITFTLLIHHEQGKLAKYLQEQLKKINVHLRIISVEPGAYFDSISKSPNYSLILTASSDYPSPYNFLTQLYGSDGNLNFLKINSPRIDGLIAALPFIDTKREADTLTHINKLIEEESIYIPLHYYSNIIVMKNKIKKVLFKFPSIMNFSSIEVEPNKR